MKRDKELRKEMREGSGSSVFGSLGIKKTKKEEIERRKNETIRLFGMRGETSG
ncbi:unnamed protein product [marine sediment metagenome]|uniref:Uncharacterized protein n=1 Tax=marine sediment metagenome TaxID=412755 RepID=X1N8V6_9ZZZZ